MNERTFRANANFVYEYTRTFEDETDVDKALRVDQKFFEAEPAALFEEHVPVYHEVDIEDITDTTTPELEEGDGMANMEPRIERAIRDWWSNHIEQGKLKTRVRELSSAMSELVAESEVLHSRINEFTMGYDRNLMLNVYEDYFVILVWCPVLHSHTIEVMRNEYGGGS